MPTTVTIDLSTLPALLAALGGGQQLALLTADGTTWMAAIVPAGVGQPPPGFAPPPARAPDPQTAFSSLVQATSATTTNTATATAVVAAAVANIAKAVPIGPGQQDQPAQAAINQETP